MQHKNDWDPSGHPAYLIGRASRLFARDADERLAKLGVTNAHVPVLRTLSDGAARSQAELAAIAKIEQPTMAQMLARMERDALVRRAPNPADGRSTLYSLTPRALAKVGAVRDVLTRGATEMFDGFSAAEIAQLGALLARAVANLER
jgi:MarR family transcriptional regulator, transcriptional regulator for hemolysin